MFKKNKQRNMFFAGLSAIAIGFWFTFVTKDTTMGLILGALGMLLILIKIK